MSDEEKEQTPASEAGKEQSPSGTEWPDPNISINSQEDTEKTQK
jgi:hypothetical protein